MKITDVRPNKGRVKERKRVGRGHASGHGKTSGRGQKGQKAREQVKPGFAGRDTRLYRRLPAKRGQSSKAHNIGIFRKEYAIVNVKTLEEKFEDGDLVTPEVLLERKIVKDLKDGLKILGEGELTKKLEVRAHAFSASAKEKIEAAGGKAEVIEK